MIQRNLIANLLGQGYSSLIGLAFVPLYIKFLGIEAYGVIGLFSVMQASFALLDAGFRPTLTREMARYTAEPRSRQRILNILRTMELIAVGLTITMALAVIAASSWLATHWLRVETLPRQQVADSIVLIGVVAALRFVEGIYSSSLIGLQRQVQLNSLNAVLGTIRAVGAVVLLSLIAPTLQVFFLWQCAVSIASVMTFSAATYWSLRPGRGRGHFSVKVLSDARNFIGGMFLITLLAFLLTQIDKLLLSTLLPLSEYGHYNLATVVAAALYLFVYPINQAFLPRFNQLQQASNHAEFVRSYHLSAQLISVFAGSAAILLMLFSEPLLRLWTQDPALAHDVAKVLSVLALGNMLNALNTVPYHMQLAFGSTRLAVKTNVCSVVFIIPAVMIVAPRYGAEGAAWVWVLHNLGQFLIFGYLTHEGAFQSERVTWFLMDVLGPIASAAVVAVIFRWCIPIPHHAVAQIGYFALCFTACIVAAATAGGRLRHTLRKKFLS
jgi:O-antigen/teichoic acid export membrane protein